MRKDSILFVCMTVLLWSVMACDRMDVHGGRSRSQTAPYPLVGDRASGAWEDKDGQVVLVSAVGYPEGFDWRRDSVYGAVSGASLLLFHGRDTVLEIPAEKPPVGTLSPDMVHFIDGHLYVETIDGAETVILRDGAEVLRYHGKEIMKGIMEYGGALFTLGQNRVSSGFSLRRNGEVLFTGSTGYVCGSMGETGYGVTGALYDGGNGPVFAYWRPMYADDGPYAPREWFFVENGVPGRVLFGTDWSVLFDARRVAGEDCYVLMKADGSRPVLQVGADEYDLSNTLIGDAAADYRLYLAADSVMFCGSYNYKSSPHERYPLYEPVNMACWNCTGRSVWYRGQGHLYADSLDTAFIRMRSGRVDGMVAPSGTYSMSDTCRIFSHECGCLAGGEFYVALTPSATGARPRLWHDGREMSIPVNGYLTGVYVTDPKSVSWIRPD